VEKIEVGGEVAEILVTPEGEILEVVEIEVYVRERKPIPKGRKYRIRIDKHYHTTEKSKLTGEEILALADKKPDAWKLYQHRHGHQPELIAPNHVVDLHLHDVERFTTMAKDKKDGEATDGLSIPIRQFTLSADDTACLENLGKRWETVIDNNNRNKFVIIHDWNLPDSYSSTHVRLALLIPPTYPDTQIDMFFVFPSISRKSGVPIPALGSMNICGEAWQQWSRHRTEGKPWRPGEDDLASHLGFVVDCLSESA